MKFQLAENFIRCERGPILRFLRLILRLSVGFSNSLIDILTRDVVSSFAAERGLACSSSLLTRGNDVAMTCSGRCSGCTTYYRNAFE